MIEINLIPDVKQELLKAQRVRTTVVSGAIVISLATIAVVVLLALFAFVAQPVRSGIAQGAIKSESDKFFKQKDLSQILTVQNQLAKIKEAHDSKFIDSRVSSVLVNLSEDISIDKLTLDNTDSTIKLEAQTPTYASFQKFKKTLAATKVQYAEVDAAKTDSPQSVDLASDIAELDRSYGIDANNQQVLTFTVSFKYPAELFSPLSSNVVIVGPHNVNATDSYQGIPTSLFTSKAQTTDGGQ